MGQKFAIFQKIPDYEAKIKLSGVVAKLPVFSAQNFAFLQSHRFFCNSLVKSAFFVISSFFWTPFQISGNC